ncbi:hypothetical protein [Sphingobacterium composti Ten et al. 2007 non Yoo et al. 2007]|uniref:hypothetical protein n=1 Tax=Sphingobacterium composti TaxID=363260 RepID=UPI0013580E8C|nr:hypothetical protein [Sphingobacterium composti Ten et al. 2007 non Yoo et al. 2007]
MKAKRTCTEGHSFYKVSDCPTCPICEKLISTNAIGFMQLLNSPARRALESQQIDSLEKLATFSEREILKLHGIGKSSIPILKSCLEKQQLSFRIDIKPKNYENK